MGRQAFRSTLSAGYAGRALRRFSLAALARSRLKRFPLSTPPSPGQSRSRHGPSCSSIGLLPCPLRRCRVYARAHTVDSRSINADLFVSSPLRSLIRCTGT